jgi:hypothetical protein
VSNLSKNEHRCQIDQPGQLHEGALLGDREHRVDSRGRPFKAYSSTLGVARLISPGRRGQLPPPTSDTMEGLVVWCPEGSAADERAGG